MTAFSSALAIACLLGVLKCASVSKPVFTMRAWDLGEYKPDKIPFWIDEAANNRINLITFSHGIAMDWWELLGGASRATAGYRVVAPVGERTKNVETWCAYAREKGIPVYLWQHVIEKPPERFLMDDTLNFDDPDLMEWLAETYRKVMDAVPSLEGFVILFTEASHQIHRDPQHSGRVTYDPMFSGKIKSALPPDERMLKITMTLYRTLKARGKKLIVRDFFRTPTEEFLFWKAMQSVPKDVTVISRHVTNDFRYNYPPNPVLGKLKDRPHIMEIEPSRRYGADYFKSLVQMARAKGMNGILPRIRHWGEKNGGDFDEKCVTALMRDPDLDLTPFWKIKYKDDRIIAILERYTEIDIAINYPLNLYIGKKDRLTDPAQNDSRMNNLGTIGYCSDRKEDVDAENLYNEGGPEAVARTVAWIQKGEALASASMQELIRAGATNEHVEAFRRAMDQSKRMQFWARAYLAFRYYRNHPGLAKAKSEAERALRAGLSSNDEKTAAYCRNLREYMNKNVPGPANPRAPTDLKAKVLPGDKIQLTWKDNSNNERMFIVERKEHYPDIYHQIALLGPDTIRFVDEHLDPSETYTYRVRANSVKGNSPHTYSVTAALSWRVSR